MKFEFNVDDSESFEGMNLRPELLCGIRGRGYERATATQERSIAPIVRGCNIVVQALPGSGKTTAFSIGVLQKLDLSGRGQGTQALIIVPYHEVGQHVLDVIAPLAKDFKTVKCHLFRGGVAVREDVARLEEEGGIHVVVSTPGRALALISRGALRVENLQIICIEEADEVLARGFREVLGDLFDRLPETIQLVVFSNLVMTSELLEFAKRFKDDLIHIAAAPRSPEQCPRRSDSVSASVL